MKSLCVCEKSLTIIRFLKSEKFKDLTILQDERFTSLDRSLQQSIKKLLEMLVETHNKIEQVMVSQGKSLNPQQDLGLFGRQRATLGSADASRVLALDEMVENHLLQSLRFPTMRHRHEEIKETYKKTFQWIFQTPSDRVQPWSNFVEWLREGNHVYWVNGKAGSGKSTLMRYCFDSVTQCIPTTYKSCHRFIQNVLFHRWARRMRRRP